MNFSSTDLPSLDLNRRFYAFSVFFTLVMLAAVVIEPLLWLLGLLNYNMLLFLLKVKYSKRLLCWDSKDIWRGEQVAAAAPRLQRFSLLVVLSTQKHIQKVLLLLLFCFCFNLSQVGLFLAHPSCLRLLTCLLTQPSS